MLVWPSSSKVLRHDADDRPQRSVEADLAADDGRIGVEARAPERLAQHDDVRRASPRPRRRNVRPAIGVTPSTSKMPAVTHCRDTVSALPSRAGHHHAADARREAGDLLERAAARVPVEHVERRDVAPRGRRRCVSQIVTRRSGSPYGSGRSSVASTSAKIALLAPMPSASVSVATQREGRRAPQLPERELHIVAELFEPDG